MATNHKPTNEAKFGHTPVNGKYTFKVGAGQDRSLALWQAAGLEESVQELLAAAVQNGMAGPTAFLCAFALDAASALRASAEAVG
jgi:hypothetical protein